MDKKKIKNLAESEQFIEGIYNYCDRWCERCPLSSKCMLFTMEQEDADSRSNDLNNREFWDQISESFQLAAELLEEWAEREGVDLSAIESEYDPREEQKRKEKMRAHPLTVKSTSYIKQVNAWLKDGNWLLQKKENSLKKQQELSIDKDIESSQINNFIEVIQWYKFQISSKIHRALSFKFSLPEERIPVQSDGNGSAKVALIGIKRSIAAWSSLLEFFPEAEDDILSFLVTLEKLKNDLENSFPDALKFKRPGFDENLDNESST